MILQAQAFDSYSASVSRQADEATIKLRSFMNSLDFSGNYIDKKASRDAVIEFIQALVDQYGNAAATLAADFYDEIAENDGVKVADAVLADTVGDASIAGSVRYSAKKLFDQEPDTDAFKRGCIAALARYVKKAANDTMSVNAVRDGGKGAKFARIPQGAETCSFCVMLASRGFVYASKETAGAFDHFHDHCDCKVIVGFGDASLEGYNLKRYETIYNSCVAYDDYGHVNQSETLKNISAVLNGDARGIQRTDYGNPLE